LDAWLAEEVLHLREADLVTVQAWFKAAQVRLEAGADPAFQVTLVEGEQLRAQADLDEARRLRLNAIHRTRGQRHPEIPLLARAARFLLRDFPGVPLLEQSLLSRFLRLGKLHGPLERSALWPQTGPSHWIQTVKGATNVNRIEMPVCS
jgi:outer membrane protein TolC